MFGFTNSGDETAQGQSSSASYIAGFNYRNDGKYIIWNKGQPFQGTSIGTGFSNGAKLVTFRIAIDTGKSADNVHWSDSEKIVGYTTAFSPEEIASITGIKLGVNGASGTYDNLAISQSPPAK